MVLGNPRFNATKDDYKKQIISTCPQDIEGPVTLHLEVWGQNEKWLQLWDAEKYKDITKYSGWDCDNKLHSVCDLLTYAHVLFDDCQVQEAHVRKRHGKGLEDCYGCRGVITEFEEQDSWPS